LNTLKNIDNKLGDCLQNSNQTNLLRKELNLREVGKTWTNRIIGSLVSQLNFI